MTKLPYTPAARVGEALTSVTPSAAAVAVAEPDGTPGTTAVGPSTAAGPGRSAGGPSSNVV